MEQRNEAIKATVFSLGSNVLLALIKAVTGILGSSFALVADSIESLVDSASSVLVMFGVKYANKPADKNHPYGHGRIETLATFAAVGFLTASGLFIVYESISNIRSPHEAPESWTIYVLLAIILWKEYSFQRVMNASRRSKSNLLKADAWHHRVDAITSVAALVGVSISLYMGEGYEAADDWAALIASVVIFYNCYAILKPVFSELMDEHHHEELELRIRDLGKEVNGIVGIEKCYVRKLGFRYIVDLHAMVDGDISVREGHKISHDLKDKLIEEIDEVGDVLIHIEPHDLGELDFSVNE